MQPDCCIPLTTVTTFSNLGDYLFPTFITMKTSPIFLNEQGKLEVTSGQGQFTYTDANPSNNGGFIYRDAQIICDVDGESHVLDLGEHDLVAIRRGDKVPKGTSVNFNVANGTSLVNITLDTRAEKTMSLAAKIRLLKGEDGPIGQEVPTIGVQAGQPANVAAGKRKVEA